jgi:hypothetical protein
MSARPRVGSGHHVCDSSGVRMLALAYEQAVAEQARLVLVVPSAAVLRMLAVTGLDLLLPVYPSLDEALSGRICARGRSGQVSRSSRSVWYRPRHKPGTSAG